MAAKYSSKLFKNVEEMSGKYEEALESVRSSAERGAEPFKAYFEAMKEAREARREANAALIEKNREVLKKLFDELKGNLSGRRDDASKSINEATEEGKA